MANLSLGTAISSAQKTATVLSGNMSASLSLGEMGFDFSVSRNITGYGIGGSQFGGSSTKFTQKITVQGDILATSIGTNLAIQGGGFFCIGENLFTRLGDFDVDGEGNLTNSAGFSLHAWKLDDFGRRPGEFGNTDIRSAANMDSLEKVNINGVLSKPKATTEISIDARLNSGASAIKGAGQIFQFSALDEYNAGNSNNDLIVPSGEGMSIGDNFTVSVGANTSTYIYGGLTSSWDISQINAFGASLSSNIFTSLPVGSTYAPGGGAVTSDQLRVVVGTNTPIDLVFNPSGPRPEAGEFNSLSTLKDAINSSPLLKARLVNNSLFIAPSDGVSSVAFSMVGGGGTDFKAALGLTDIAEYTGAGNQFSTITQLKEYLQQNTLLSAINPSSGTGIDISVKDPLQGVTFASYSARKNSIGYISGVQTDANSSTGSLASTSLMIKAPMSGLKIGDFVRIEGLQGDAVFGSTGATFLPNGTYPVLSVTDGGFAIPAHLAINAGGVGNRATEAALGTPSWQKVPVSSTVSVDLGAGDTIERAIIAPAATNAVVTITHNGHGFVDNDVINITGIGFQNNIGVPNGLYSVTGATANTFEITVPQLADPGTAAQVAAPLTSGKAVKVGTTTTDHTVETSIAFSAVGNLITVQMPNNDINQGDYIAIAGTPLYPSTDGVRYRVVSSNLTSFTFEVASAADAAGLIAAMTTPGSLPTGNYIDYFGKLDGNIGFDQAKNQQLMSSIYNPTDGSGANLVTGEFEGKWDQPITIHDALGNPHAFNISFAKISDLKWAAQIYATKNPVTGQYPITAGSDGIVASGSVTFNGSGTLDSIDSITVFDLNWNNGSDRTTVTLDVGEVANAGSTSLFSSGGIKHVYGSNQALAVTQNGYQPGRFSYLSVEDDTGTIYANYDNGATQAIYVVPLCYVTAPNGMKPLGNAVFTTTYESGPVLLKQSGDDGVGIFIAKAIEKANIESIEEMMKLVEITGHAAYLSAAQQQLIDMQKDYNRRV